MPIGVIHDDPALSMAWLKGVPIARGATKHEVERIVEALEKVDEQTMTKTMSETVQSSVTFNA